MLMHVVKGSLTLWQRQDSLLNEWRRGHWVSPCGRIKVNPSRCPDMKIHFTRSTWISMSELHGNMTAWQWTWRCSLDVTLKAWGRSRDKLDYIPTRNSWAPRTLSTVMCEATPGMGECVCE